MLGILKGKNSERPRASAKTLDKFYLSTDVRSVKIGIALSAKEYGWYEVSGPIDAEDVSYDGSAWATPVSDVKQALDYLYTNLGGSGVMSVTGLNTNNTDPQNPIVQISVDGVTVTGNGTPGSPLVAASGVTPAALTKTDDTNVTLTLGGSPSTALLAATSLTLGWTGTLADGRIASAATWNAKQTAYAILTTLGSLANASGVLTNNGAGVLSWAAAATVAGSDTQIQFNQGGAFGASSNLIFDYTNKYLGVGGTPTAVIHAKLALTTSILSESTGTTGEDAHVRMKVSGASGGDPHLQFDITGVTSWSMGVDNSDSDAFVLSASATLGTTNRLRITTAGNITTGVWQATAVDIPYGGTNATTAAGARVNLLPSLSGNTLKVLRVNAGETDVEWATASGGVSDADYGDISVTGSGATWTIDNNVVTYAKFQQVAALSVVGNSTNALANAAAISAGSDYQILRRTGTAIAFGSIDLSQSAAVGTSRLAYANITQLAGLSVLGVTGTSTADVAALTGTANQVLRVNGAGTSLAFGQLNLSSPSAVTGTLASAKGGTDNNTYTIGDLLQASASTTLSVLSSVSAGSYLRSGGVGTVSAWSTLKLPNTATQYYIPYPATANNYNESANLQFDGTNLSIGGASSGHRLNIISGTLADQKNALKITATLTAGGTNDQIASYWTITTAGTSSTLSQVGLRIDMAAGYTGTHYSAAFVTVNSVAGTGTSITGAKANFGFTTNASATTTGYNIGLRGNVGNGNLNVGAYGAALIAKNSATNIGVLGLALNTGSSPIQVGGYFGLQNADPTFASAALMCDNGSQSSDIFVARDNGTAKWSIVDGGNTTWADAVNMVFNATTGTKIGTATTQKIGIWNATPIVQPTTAVAAATFVANTSAIADDTATFDGYTIGQVVKALRNIGLLA